MTTIMRFEDIEAWKTARQLTNLVYKLSNKGGFSRDFGLRDQMRRASISVLSNIAEGFESRTQAQFINYLGQAKASAGEVRAQLYIANDQGYITKEEFDEAFDLADKGSRQLHRFITYLETKSYGRRVREGRVEYEISR